MRLWLWPMPVTLAPPAPCKLLALFAQAGDVRYSLAPRRSALRSCPTAQSWADGPTMPERRTPAQTFRSWPWIRAAPGRLPPWTTVTAAGSVPWRWLRRPLSGTARDCPRAHTRWVLVRDPQGAFASRLCSAPILVPGLSRSWGGSSCVGKWRRAFRKRGGIWVWRHKDSSRSWQSGGPPQRYWDCSRS